MFETYITGYLDHLAARGYAQGTRYWHASYLRQFCAWLEKRDLSGPMEVTAAHVAAYQVHLKTEHRTPRDTPLAESTYQSHLAAIAGFFKWLEKSGWILINPAPVERRKKPKPFKLPRVMAEEEALRILDSCPINTPVGLRDRAMLEILYSTGLRRSELIRLDVREFSPERGELAISQGKGKKDRVVPLGDYALTFTQAYLKLVRPWLVGSPDEEALFLNSRTGERLDGETVAYLVKKAIRRAGVKKHVTPHTFRHSMATHMLRNKADLRHIQAILGHASLESTQVYTHLAFEDLKAAIKRAHPRGRRK